MPHPPEVEKRVEPDESYIVFLDRVSQGVLMFVFTTHDARTRFGEMLDRARRAPVRIMHRNREVGALVSSEDYAAMRAFYANRLANTLEDNAIEAETKGLTAAELKHLLADES